MASKRPGTREITKRLMALAEEAEDMTPDGDIITKTDALARLIWKKALGYTETVHRKDGKKVKVTNPPEVWAIQLVYDRLEGRIDSSSAATEAKERTAQRVSDLTKQRLNKLTVGEGTSGKKAPPPPRPKKSDE